MAVGSLAAGCGRRGTPPPPSRQEYASAADRICGANGDALAALAKERRDLGKLDRDIGAVRRRLAASVVARSKLKRPVGTDGDVAKQWVAALRREQPRNDALLQEVQEAIRSHDARRMKAAARHARALGRFSEANRLAQHLDMKSCPLTR